MSRCPIVIVNYRTPGLVIDLLRSLDAEARAEGLRAVIVENGSPDDSASQLRQAIDSAQWDWAELIVCAKNLGFAGGNNVALRPILAQTPPPDYVLLLNPDTVVRPGAVRALIDFMEANPKVGIAGSGLENPDGSPQRSAFRFPSMASELENGLRLGIVSRLLRHALVAPPVEDRPHETGWVSGASMIVRRAVFDAIGPMDDAYFLYYEETDFCLRAKRAGWPCWYAPSSRVMHLAGQSTGVTDPRKPARRMPAYWFASRHRYFRKNHGWLYTKAADLAWAGGYALWRVRRVLQRKPDTDPPHLLGDFVRYNFLARHPV